MTEFLIRTFVRDYKNIDDARVRTGYGVMASTVGIICNVLLFLAKLFTGLLVNSISVMADAFNNLSDAASSVISFVGVKIAEKPADEAHPFGHGRVEYIAAFIVAFIVIQVGFTLFKTSVGKVLQPEQMTFQPVSVVILILSVCIKLWMGLFNRKLGKRIRSSVMLAAAADSMSDVGATAAALLSVVVYGLWGLNIDGIMGVAVSIAVMWAGVGIAKDTLSPLIGQPIDPELYRNITDFVEGFDGIEGSHDLIVHNYGPSKIMASIHAEVPNDVGIEISHEIIDLAEREALRRFGILLVIHMDPIEMRDNRVLEYKKLVAGALAEVDPKCKFHDFRMIDGEKKINLIFDLVVPRDYGSEARKRIEKELTEKIERRDARCCLVMTSESGFGVED